MLHLQASDLSLGSLKALSQLQHFFLSGAEVSIGSLQSGSAGEQALLHLSQLTALRRAGVARAAVAALCVAHLLLQRHLPGLALYIPSTSHMTQSQVSI